jgi:hypothetical protein
VPGSCNDEEVSKLCLAADAYQVLNNIEGDDLP